MAPLYHIIVKKYIVLMSFLSAYHRFSFSFLYSYCSLLCCRLKLSSWYLINIRGHDWHTFRIIVTGRIYQVLLCLVIIHNMLISIFILTAWQSTIWWLPCPARVTKKVCIAKNIIMIYGDINFHSITTLIFAQYYIPFIYLLTDKKKNIGKVFDGDKKHV